MWSRALLFVETGRMTWVALELNSSQCRHSATWVAIGGYMDVWCVFRSYIITCHRISVYFPHLKIDFSLNRIIKFVRFVFFSSSLIGSSSGSLGPPTKKFKQTIFYFSYVTQSARYCTCYTFSISCDCMMLRKWLCFVINCYIQNNVLC